MTPTTLRGLALPESVSGQHRLAAAIEDRKPDVVAIWAQGMNLDTDAYDAIRARGIEPIVYATTARWTADDILAGDHDKAIEGLAIDLAGTDTIVRLNQEANGPGLRAEWCTWSPETYIAVFRYVSRRIRASAPNVRMAYCIAWRGRDHADDFQRWFPGYAWCQVAGFDSYVTNPVQRPSRIWPAAVRAIRTTTSMQPIWVFEAGVSRIVPFRGRRLREMLTVPGIKAVVLMDMDIEHYGKPHRWGLTERLRRLWR